jgi:hypothetical protein
LWRSGTDQFANSFQQLLLGPIGKVAVVPDPHESTWQHVPQEATDELVGRQSELLPPVSIATIPVGERDLAVSAGD